MLLGGIMDRFNRLWLGIQQEGKVFIFFAILLMVFRIIFLCIFNQELSAVSMHKIWLSVWYGFRSSLGTIGAICIGPFFLATVIRTFNGKWPAQLIRRLWYSLVTFVGTMLFVLRIPYYETYHIGFSRMVIHELENLIGQVGYQYISYYFIGGLLLSAILIKLVNKVISTDPLFWEPKNPGQLWIRTIETVIIILVFGVFCRYFGAFTHNHTINWQKVGRDLQYPVLRVAMLDDMQALYRITVHDKE